MPCGLSALAYVEPLFTIHLPHQYFSGNSQAVTHSHLCLQVLDPGEETQSSPLCLCPTFSSVHTTCLCLLWPPDMAFPPVPNHAVRRHRTDTSRLSMQLISQQHSCSSPLLLCWCLFLSWHPQASDVWPFVLICVCSSYPLSGPTCSSLSSSSQSTVLYILFFSTYCDIACYQFLFKNQLNHVLTEISLNPVN